MRMTGEPATKLNLTQGRKVFRFRTPKNHQKNFAVIRTRSVLKLLQGLGDSIATGQDDIGARILKELAHSIAVPITILYTNSG